MTRKRHCSVLNKEVDSSGKAKVLCALSPLTAEQKIRKLEQEIQMLRTERDILRKRRPCVSRGMRRLTAI